jgi:hypothetical protein
VDFHLLLRSLQLREYGRGSSWPKDRSTYIFEGLLMTAPKLCPHCGTHSIKPTFLYATLSLSFDRINSKISGVHAYCCDTGHFFIVFGAEKDVEEPDGEARGSEDRPFLCNDGQFCMAVCLWPFDG